MTSKFNYPFLILIALLFLLTSCQRGESRLTQSDGGKNKIQWPEGENTAPKMFGLDQADDDEEKAVTRAYETPNQNVPYRLRNFYFPQAPRFDVPKCAGLDIRRVEIEYKAGDYHAMQTVEMGDDLPTLAFLLTHDRARSNPTSLPQGASETPVQVYSMGQSGSRMEVLASIMGLWVANAEDGGRKVRADMLMVKVPSIDPDAGCFLPINSTTFLRAQRVRVRFTDGQPISAGSYVATPPGMRLVGGFIQPDNMSSSVACGTLKKEACTAAPGTTSVDTSARGVRSGSGLAVYLLGGILNLLSGVYTAPSTPAYPLNVLTFYSLE